MKIHNRILSTLLAVILLLGVVPCFTIGAAADGNVSSDEDVESLYINTKYNTPEDKLFGVDGDENNLKGNFQLKLARGNYKLYVDSVSGEVAVYNTVSKDILFSNPYDNTASEKSSKNTKGKILSQIIVSYTDNKGGSGTPLYSFTDAAMRDQIKVLNIKNGVRVEYTIGQEEARKLVPQRISDENFQKYILGPLKEASDNGEFDIHYYNKFIAYFIPYSTEGMSDRAAELLIQEYPILEFKDIWVFDPKLTSKDLNYCEQYIKAYCEDYTFEQMDADHEETGYEEDAVQNPVFKMALEYSLDEDGLSVRLPCNGLRYNMAAYTLTNLCILPYMGAGNGKNPGYNFFPDGSGSLFEFEKLNDRPGGVREKVYGRDYAYHTISGENSAYEKAIRYPVYGTVASESLYTFTYGVPSRTGSIKSHTVTVSSTVMNEEQIRKYVSDLGGSLTSEITEETYERGFLAVIEEGESLAEIETNHDSAESDFHSIRSYFNPKPSDSYDISDAISVVGSSTVTVVSERKYTGSIRIRYIMLTDEKEADVIKATDPSFTYYETSWFGMAEAYRDYLVKEGVLKPLKTTEENIPLYIEVFGAFETMQTIATIPMNVMTPLTTFENIQEMYNKLSAEGVKNINFKMTGYANGGMFSEVPAALKWEKNVGGKAGFQALVEEAKKINATEGQHIGLYPDFDFAYIQRNELFDSTILKDDAVKTIDNRYTSYRQYSATAQMYVSFYQLAVSPSRYSKFYNKLMSNYDGYDWKYMSVASLGTALNSDFDEDDPYNREDSKDFTVQAFQDMKAAGYSLMTDGSNAYTWGYVDHILNLDLDSSRYVDSSASVPFLGVVLHGYVQFAGAPLNEESDVDYALLRALENGAGLYFILSYQNTQELKENGILSQYYSVRYDIWEEDVINYYNEMNSLLKDVQTKIIIDHEFLNDATRVLDAGELKELIEAELKAAAEAAEKELQDITTDKLLEVADAWQMAETAEFELGKIIENVNTLKSNLQAENAMLDGYISNLESSTRYYLGCISNDQGESMIKEALETLGAEISSCRDLAVKIMGMLDELDAQNSKALDILANLENAEEIIRNADTLDQDVKDKMIEEVGKYKENAKPLVEEVSVLLDSLKNVSKDRTVDKVITALRERVTNVAEEVGRDRPSVANRFASEVPEYLFSAEELYEENRLSGDTTGDENQDSVEEDDPYLSTDNQVVLVTYGDRDAVTHEKTSFKSFILNYNNYAVRVTYNNVCYTIPSGGYVVIYH